MYGLIGSPRDWQAILLGTSGATHLYNDCTCAACKGRNPRMTKKFVVFSDNTNSGPNGGYGEQFVKWLRENNLGDVTEVCSGKNPNTGNTIKLWSWDLPATVGEFKALLEAAKV
jgi:hypothetical protein